MDKSVERYLADIPDDRRDVIDALHRLIVDLFPQATVDMKHRMPTYSVGEGWVALANQKRYVSLYTCGAHHLVRFKAKHPKIKTGTGCINLKPADPLPLDDLSEVIRHAIEHPKDV